MNIHFYLNGTDEAITSFHKLSSNPFKLNDVVSLYVDTLYPKDYADLKESLRADVIRKNEESKAMFSHKQVTLVKEKKYVEFDVLNESKITIEYHCVFVADKK